jgi:hypothetical protein
VQITFWPVLTQRPDAVDTKLKFHWIQLFKTELNIIHTFLCCSSSPSSSSSLFFFLHFSYLLFFLMLLFLLTFLLTILFILCTTSFSSCNAVTFTSSPPLPFRLLARGCSHPCSPFFPLSPLINDLLGLLSHCWFWSLHCFDNRGIHQTQGFGHHKTTYYKNK